MKRGGLGTADWEIHLWLPCCAVQRRAYDGEESDIS